MGTIADKLQYTADAKDDIRVAIVAKGVDCPGSAALGDYDEYIAKISGGGGVGTPQLNAPTDIQILKCKTLRIVDQAVNGIFSQSTAVRLNGALYATFNMANGVGNYDFEEGELNVGDTIAAMVTSPQFLNSDQFSRVLDKGDFLQYGDGSLNTETNGYNGHIFINGVEIETPVRYTNYFSGNFNNEDNWSDAFNNNSAGYTSYSQPLFGVSTTTWGKAEMSKSGDCYQTWLKVMSSTYKYETVVCDATEHDRTCRFWFQGGYYTRSWYFGDMLFNVESFGDLTLEQMVEQEIITPMVLIRSGTSEGPYWFPSTLNLYTGGRCQSGNYGSCVIYFTLNEGYKINFLTMYSNRNTETNYPDGMLFTHFRSDLFSISYVD